MTKRKLLSMHYNSGLSEIIFVYMNFVIILVSILGFLSLSLVILLECGPGSSVSIATDYGLDGPGIESRWGRDFSLTSHPAHCTMVTGSFPGVKQPGRGADHPPPPTAEVENEYNYTSIPPLGPWWPVIG
jgi:hypothetical protein